VFSIVLKPEVGPRVYDAMGRLKLFAIGASWGGTRSLIAPMAIAPDRSVRPWNPAEQVVRLSIGLEEPGELWSDPSGFLVALAEG
jgi:cystathionine beta-lyase